MFFGGFYRIKLDNLRLLDTKQNFQDFIKAIWYFDAMITGGALKGIKIKSKTNVLIINNLIKYQRDTLNTATTTTTTTATTATFDKYIYATFSSFTLHKKMAVLNLHKLYDGANKAMRDLIIYKMEQRDYDEESKRNDKDFSNLFRSEIFAIFPNIKTLIIITTNDRGWDSYSLSMSCLLRTISSSYLDQIIIKSVETMSGGYNWINKLWQSDSKKMKKEYGAKNYSISMKKEKGTNDNDEYWFVVKCVDC